MLRILRAFAWLRWRMLVNSLEKTGSRDVLERFSLAIEKLGPILAAVLLIPSAIALAGLGIAAGYTLATGQQPLLFTVTLPGFDDTVPYQAFQAGELRLNAVAGHRGHHHGFTRNTRRLNHKPAAYRSPRNPAAPTPYDPAL